MNAARKLNKFLERHVYMVIFAGLILGFSFQEFFLSAKDLVPWVFALTTLGLALGTGTKDLKRVFYEPIPLALIFLCIHGFSPLFAYFLGKYSYGVDSPFSAGLILAAAIPVGVSSILWTGLAGGYLPLALTTVSIDSLLSPIIVPLMISFFLRRSIAFDTFSLSMGLLQMVVIPTIIGVFIHDISKGRIEKIDRWWINLYTKISLGFIVAVNIAASRENLFHPGITTLFLVVSTFILFNFALGYGVAKLMEYPDNVNRSFIFVVGLRNSSVGIVIALNYFPPEVAFPLITALMLQQPTAGILQSFLQKRATR